jgi:hypothetical protein
MDAAANPYDLITSTNDPFFSEMNIFNGARAHNQDLN